MKTDNMTNNSQDKEANAASGNNMKGMQADKTAVNNLKKNHVKGAANCPVDNTMKGVSYMPPKDENTL